MSCGRIPVIRNFTDVRQALQKLHNDVSNASFPNLPRDISYHRGLHSMQYYSSPRVGTTLNWSDAVDANTLYVVPFVVARGLHINAMAVAIASKLQGDVGSVVRLGIYDDSVEFSEVSGRSNVFPHHLVHDAGTIPLPNQGNPNTIAADCFLVPGLYWLAMVHDSTIAAPHFAHHPYGTLFCLGGTQSESNGEWGYYASIGGTTFPAVFPENAYGNLLDVDIPAIWVQVGTIVS